MVPGDRTTYDLNRDSYIKIPTLTRSGQVDPSDDFGYISREKLMNSIPGFPKMDLAFFRITENARGPKFLFGEWLLVDIAPDQPLETGDFCLKASVGLVARQLTVLDANRVVVLSAANGVAAPVDNFSRREFDDRYAVVGRIIFVGNPSSPISR
jgi:hypothetical protein